MNGGIMIKNYMKIVLRNTLKYKSYSLINIAGLGIWRSLRVVYFALGAG